MDSCRRHQVTTFLGLCETPPRLATDMVAMAASRSKEGSQAELCWGAFLASSLADDQHTVGGASMELYFYEPERSVPGKPPGTFMGGGGLAARDSIILKPIPLAYSPRRDFPLCQGCCQLQRRQQRRPCDPSKRVRLLVARCRS